MTIRYNGFMKLILAQGNPGVKFVETRHNVGFRALERFADDHGLHFQAKSRWNAEVAEQGSGESKILLVKPSTFYNETGQAARALVDFYHIDPRDVLVIHDELALPFGTLRTRQRGSDAGNNGIKSLNAHLGQDYTRLRVGIANELLAHMAAMEFVLGNFSKEEKTQLDTVIFPKTNEIIDKFIDGSLEITSHKL